LSEKETQKVYQCAACGVVTSAEGHLCDPKQAEIGCYRRDQPPDGDRHMCEPMREKLAYVCETCGRPTEEPRLVCRPRKRTA